MKIGIDISQIIYQGSGVARYTQALAEALIEFDKKNTYVFFFSSLRSSIPHELKKMVKSPHQVIRHYLPPRALSALWNDLHMFPIEALIGDVDIFISSDWTQPPVKKAKSVTIIHDLVVYRYPETSHPTIVRTQKKRLNRVAKECDHVITDSESTKKDITEILHIDAEKIDVVYPYIESIHEATPVSEVRHKYNLTRPFILCVGKIEPRKNIKRAIEAFIKADIKNVDLVIVGPNGWGDIENSVQRDQRVKMLGFVPDRILWTLYKEAEMFVYPSLYEGFGYPIIEAMKAGTPVITSNNSSLSEISGDAALLCDPEEVDDISDKMKKLYYNQTDRKEYVRKGSLHAEKFSKKHFAEQFIKVLESL